MPNHVFFWIFTIKMILKREKDYLVILRSSSIRFIHSNFVQFKRFLNKSGCFITFSQNAVCNIFVFQEYKSTIFSLEMALVCFSKRLKENLFEIFFNPSCCCQIVFNGFLFSMFSLCLSFTNHQLDQQSQSHTF